VSDSDFDIAVATMQAKLRPLYAVFAGGVMLLGSGVVYVYDLATFIVEDSAHERQQDENLLTLKTKLDEHEGALKKARDRDMATIKLLIDDLALLRAVQLQALPHKRREHVRAQFEHQRKASIELLVEAQK